MQFYFLSGNPLFSSLRIALNSRNAIKTAAAAEIKSATGPVYKIPSIPKNIGSTISSGKKKIICLVSDRKMPLIGFPIEVKKVAVTG